MQVLRTLGGFLLFAILFGAFLLSGGNATWLDLD